MLKKEKKNATNIETETAKKKTANKLMRRSDSDRDRCVGDDEIAIEQPSHIALQTLIKCTQIKSDNGQSHRI